jgi:hypothetical protein
MRRERNGAAGHGRPFAFAHLRNAIAALAGATLDV